MLLAVLTSPVATVSIEIVAALERETGIVTDSVSHCAKVVELVADTTVHRPL